MSELFLEDDSTDCDFDFMPDVAGSSKSKQTSDQAKENLGYKTVQQYMANLSGIEVYRAMLDIVYTRELDDQDLQQDNDTTVKQGKQQEAATATKRKHKVREQDAADDNDDNDDATATDTPNT
ncbi:hypothetical protein GQ42DRAFT_166060, partial [Ramicandelaber brevisporus]